MFRAHNSFFTLFIVSLLGYSVSRLMISEVLGELSSTVNNYLDARENLDFEEADRHDDDITSKTANTVGVYLGICITYQGMI